MGLIAEGKGLFGELTGVMPAGNLIDIESTNSESTIAGYLLEIAERIPDVKDKFEDDCFEYIITKMDGNKIDTITTILKPKNEDE